MTCLEPGLPRGEAIEQLESARYNIYWHVDHLYRSSAEHGWGLPTKVPPWPASYATAVRHAKAFYRGSDGVYTDMDNELDIVGGLLQQYHEDTATFVAMYGPDVPSTLLDVPKAEFWR